MTVEELPAAEYVVARAQLKNITARWLELYEWIAEQGHEDAGHGLEEHLCLPKPEPLAQLSLDLWLPIRRGHPAE